jgi:hypothetical protein
MTLTAFWLRLELRRRGRALVVLALLVALATGTVLAAVAGARRTGSAVDRLLAVTLPATVEVSPQQPFFDWDAVRRLPGVAAVTTFPSYTGFGVEEVPGDPVGRYLPADDQVMRTVERPVVLAGRLADPTRPDEAVVTQRFVDRSGYGVGAGVTLRLFSPEQVASGASGVPSAVVPHPDGPAQRVRIVGVVRSLWLGDRPDDAGRLFPTPALVAAYPDSVLGRDGSGAVNAIVRLDAGAAGLDAFRAELAGLGGGRPDRSADPGDPTAVGAIDVTGRDVAVARVRDIAAFEAGCLLAFAGAALLAALVLVGQAVGRYCADALAELGALRAMGMTGRQAVAAAVVGPALAGLVGTGLGIGAAVAASPLFPFGTAADLEPAPGVAVDPLVLAVGGALAVLAVTGAAGAAATLRLLRAARPAPLARPRGSGLTRVVAAAGLPVPLVVGVRFALDPGAAHDTGRRGERDRVPVRSVLLAVVAGVLGSTAALVFAAGAADAAAQPARFGQADRLAVGYGCCGRHEFDVGSVNAALTADPDVVALDDSPFAVAEAASGATGITAVLFTGPPDEPAVTAGRVPQVSGEVLLAPATARQLGAGPGAEVRFTGDAGSAVLRVVGVGLLRQTPYNTYDAGGWVGGADYHRLFSGFLNDWGLVRLRPGADPATVAERLDRAADAAGAHGTLFPSLPVVPDRVAQIRDVRVLPLALGGFLALLGIGAAGHGLATAVRHRRRDVAVLRALGMTRGQTRVAALVQAVVTVAVGLLVGLPLGLALGRALWRAVAEITPLQYLPPAALTPVVVVMAGAVVLAALLAGWAGRRAVRLRVPAVLRAE